MIAGPPATALVRPAGRGARDNSPLTRIEDWEAVGAVHGEFYGEIRPANTVVQVTRFIDPEWLVEVEADAVAGDEGG